jgi:erythromycin esterase
MAENSQWLISPLQVGKVSLWAHDHHIGNWSAYCGLPMMGAYLKRQFRQQYLAVGMSMSNGSFNALNVATALSFGVFPEQSQEVPTSYNYLLGKAKYANFVLNLNQALLEDSLSDWLTQEHLLFEPGGLYDTSRPNDYYYAPSKLKGRYDLLIHFRDTTPSQLLR